MPITAPVTAPIVPTRPARARRFAAWQYRRRLALAPLALGLLLPGADVAAWQNIAPTVTDWSYQGERGPEHWARLGAVNAACGSGQRQSPVALESRAAASLACQPLKFRYRSSALFVKNDGHALRLGYDRGSYLSIDGLSYELTEVRFHVPGEHALDGRVADAEVQLVHGNNRGDMAIVAVPVVAGLRNNQTLSRILEHAPTTAGESVYRRNVGINTMFLLPGRKDYFTYEGSLTRPPCTEGVRWFVLGSPLEVDPGEIQRLARLTSTNARPLQPLAGRPVAKAACDAN